MSLDRTRAPLSLMTIHAHPDDEVIGTGGALLRYAEEGISTVLVCCTGGEEGEIHDPDLDPVEAAPRLGEIRARELDCAAEHLKIGTVERLGYRDSGMAGTPANQHPASFHQADLDEATARLVRLIRQHRPTVLVSYDAHGSYGHPDHIKAYQITRAAFQRAADPSFAPETALPLWQPRKLYETTMPRENIVRWREIWRAERAARAAAAGEPAAEAADENPDPFDLEKHSRPLAEITTILDVRPYLSARQEALRCHRTQIPQDSHFFREADALPADLIGYEHYVRVQCLDPAPAREDDLFAGLR
jgi:LmbE family N-acetylglucosaminyl deacetylase